MKAQFVFEKFSEEDDPIHSMGIGTPLGIAGGHLQRYAHEHGYEFQMVPIRKQESPIMFVDVKPYYDKFSGFPSRFVYVYKMKYTITYMPHQAPTIYSLRKEWVGYGYVATKDDSKQLNNLSSKEFDDYKLRKLKQNIQNGNVKQIDLKQALMGRYAKFQIPEMIKRIDDNINFLKGYEKIDEAFAEESDPIKDLGIGQININKDFKSYTEGYKFICKYLIPYIIGNDDIKSIINPASRNNAIIAPIEPHIYQKIYNYVIQYLSVNGNKFDLGGHDLQKYITIDKLRESFTEDSDPVKDMGIGL
jgi:hypothetical protein